MDEYTTYPIFILYRLLTVHLYIRFPCLLPRSEAFALLCLRISTLISEHLEFRERETCLQIFSIVMVALAVIHVLI